MPSRDAQHDFAFPDVYISDTDLLSSFIKADYFYILLSLFEVKTIYVAPAVLHELEQIPVPSVTVAIQELLSTNQLEVVSLTDEEVQFGEKLPTTLGPGERQTIAYAKFHNGIVLSNESRVAHWCSQIGIQCVRLPVILRKLWQTQILTVDEVRKIIQLLQERDQMRFNNAILTGIFDTEE